MPTTGDGARYHPGVIWGPFLLALALGLVVSAGLYFAYMWPHVEPLDEDEEPEAATTSSAAPAETASADDSPAPEAPAAEPPTATAAEPPSEAATDESKPAETSESPPA
jgi:hypothetical protein